MTPREMAKSVARLATRALALPFVVSFVIRARVFDRDRALMASTQLLALVPGLFGQYLRRGFLQAALAQCDSTVVVEWGTTFSRAGARLERDAYVGPSCHIGLVHIQPGALIAAGVHIPSGALTHGIGDPDIPIGDQPRQERMVTIGAGVWIGSGAVVMADVGNGTVVGAGAVVTRPLPASVVAAGVPARIVRSRAATRRAV